PRGRRSLQLLCQMPEVRLAILRHRGRVRRLVNERRVGHSLAFSIRSRSQSAPPSLSSFFRMAGMRRSAKTEVIGLPLASFVGAPEPARAPPLGLGAILTSVRAFATAGAFGV